MTSTGPVAHCLNAGGMGRIDYESETMVAHTLRGGGHDASEDGTGRGTPIVPIAYRTTGNDGVYETGDVVHAITTATDPNSHILAHPVAIQGAATRENPSSGPDGVGVCADGAAFTLEARSEVQAVCFDCKGTQVQTYGSGAAPTLRSMAHDGSHQNGGGQLAVATGWAVRRLTPTECLRLQGFPDDYFAEAEPIADGPKYKMLGNSMAVNVMRWIGERIQAVEDIGA